MGASYLGALFAFTWVGSLYLAELLRLPAPSTSTERHPAPMAETGDITAGNGPMIPQASQRATVGDGRPGRQMGYREG